MNIVNINNGEAFEVNDNDLNYLLNMGIIEFHPEHDVFVFEQPYAKYVNDYVSEHGEKTKESENSFDKEAEKISDTLSHGDIKEFKNYIFIPTSVDGINSPKIILNNKENNISITVACHFTKGIDITVRSYEKKYRKKYDIKGDSIYSRLGSYFEKSCHDILFKKEMIDDNLFLSLVDKSETKITFKFNKIIICLKSKDISRGNAHSSLSRFINSRIYGITVEKFKFFSKMTYKYESSMRWLEIDPIYLSTMMDNYNFLMNVVKKIKSK